MRQPEHRAVPVTVEVADPVRSRQQRWRVPGARPADLARGPVERHARRCGRARPGHPGGEPVEQLQGRGGPVALQQRGGQRAAQLSHHGGGHRALPDDVADRDRHPVLVQLDHVVPVAARLDALCAGQVPGVQQEARELRQPLRQQAALQRLGHPVLGPVEPGPIQRLGALLGQREQRRPLDRTLP